MSDDIYEAAARWHQAQARDDIDWDAFAAWLDADPRHRDAYDDIALLDEDIDRSRDTIVAMLPANDSDPHLDHGRSRGRSYLMFGSAAAILLVVSTVGLLRDRASTPPAAIPRSCCRAPPCGSPSRERRAGAGSRSRWWPR